MNKIVNTAGRGNSWQCLVACLFILSLTSGCRPERLSPEDLPPRKTASKSLGSKVKEEANVPDADTAGSKMAVDETQSQQPDPPSLDDQLREAAMAGDIEKMNALSKEGASVRSQGPQGRAALQLAAFDGHTEAVQWLLDRNATVDHRDEFGRTALMYAATGDNADTVKLLLKSGADPNLVDSEEEFSPLMFAAAEGQLKVVNLLLDHDADPSLKDIDGETAIQFAQSNGKQAVVKRLSELE